MKSKVPVSVETMARRTQDSEAVGPLTICSVSFASAPYLYLNRQLTARLNGTGNWKWIVVENTPPGSEGAVGRGDGFVVLDGVARIPAGGASGSYQHGEGLNKASPHIKTRFALFLDPDFYIVRRGWICEILNHMLTHQLVFFGAPWNPKWFMKYRYFPCVHCLFIDLSQVDAESLDFAPDRPELIKPSGVPPFLKQKIPPPFLNMLLTIKGVLWHLKVGSLQVGTTKDTGYDIYRRFGLKKPTPSECVVPVFRPESDFLGPRLAHSKIGRFVDRILPDRMSFIPKLSGSYTREGFREHGYPDVTSLGWEEFIWKGKPFGFHLRRQGRGSKDSAVEKRTLEQVIENFGKKEGKEDIPCDNL